MFWNISIYMQKHEKKSNFPFYGINIAIPQHTWLKHTDILSHVFYFQELGFNQDG